MVCIEGVDTRPEHVRRPVAAAREFRLEQAGCTCEEGLYVRPLRCT